VNTQTRKTDILILGGGTAGCYAAITAARQRPDLSILLVEKANIQRSGCLAAGVNAINAYLPNGQTPESYVDFVRWDAEGILRDDLVLTMAQGLNEAVEDLERLGLVILKDDQGNYVTRGKNNIKINGENIKPLLAKAVKSYPNVTVLNHINVTDYLTDGTRVTGAAGFSVNEETAWFFQARAVLCATGGAAGLYRPNNPGFSRHKMWYPPFNTGAGYAMGIRAGAEMTTFEMRFVAQRCKDTIAPTGTIALGVGAREINSLGQCFEGEYGLSTSGRAFGVANETHQGRGPCYLETEGITPQQDKELLKAYLNMAPSQTLKWIESGKLPSAQNVELEGTEPYVVGGHTASGYWVDTSRRTTLPGLYAAGDVAGGSPKKFVSGALAEGKLAVEAILSDLDKLPFAPIQGQEAIENTYVRQLNAGSENNLYTIEQLEEAMQKIMDNYAGGLSTGYRYNEKQLALAQEKIESLSQLWDSLGAQDTDELLHLYELKDRLTICPVLIAHLAARKETRWPGFGINTDHPQPEESWANTYVNSHLVDGKPEILYRTLVKGGQRYEHSDR
jgi:adenylylsulfate reductase subunit A